MKKLMFFIGVMFFALFCFSQEKGRIEIFTKSSTKYRTTSSGVGYYSTTYKPYFRVVDTNYEKNIGFFACNLKKHVSDCPAALDQIKLYRKQMWNEIYISSTIPVWAGLIAQCTVIEVGESFFNIPRTACLLYGLSGFIFYFRKDKKSLYLTTTAEKYNECLFEKKSNSGFNTLKPSNCCFGLLPANEHLLPGVSIKWTLN